MVYSNRTPNPQNARASGDANRTNFSEKNTTGKLSSINIVFSGERESPTMQTYRIIPYLPESKYEESIKQATAVCSEVQQPIAKIVPITISLPSANRRQKLAQNTFNHPNANKREYTEQYVKMMKRRIEQRYRSNPNGRPSKELM